MGHILALCDYYMPIFEETFSKYGLPDELKYMAIIESALNPRAVSRAGAKGMWQFMFRTAKSYGLEIDSYVDERLDPYKSADAAARYLRDSYNVFGDWCLAISSYNCGPGNVSKAIRRAGGTKDFWRIYDFLPRETRGYMPAFVGAMYAVNYYKEHGIKPEKLQLPTHIDTLDIHKMLHFKQLSGILGIPEDYLRNLNPQYLHDIIPGSEKHSYTLRLPYNFTSNFVSQEDSVYTFMADSLFNPVMVSTVKEQAKTSSRITYVVKKGDFLGRIASRYHVSVAQLKRWNNLRSDNIRVGQRLYIHR
jgi:membrane-bound lytic murein transglycosylase D